MNKKLKAILCLLGVGVMTSCATENFGPVVTPEKGIELLTNLRGNEVSKMDAIPMFTVKGHIVSKRISKDLEEKNQFDSETTFTFERSNKDSYLKYTLKEREYDVVKDTVYYSFIKDGQCIVVNNTNKTYAINTVKNSNDPVEAFKDVCSFYGDGTRFIEEGFYSGIHYINECIDHGNYMLKHLKVHSKNENDVTVKFNQTLEYADPTSKGSKAFTLKVRDKIATTLYQSDLYYNPNSKNEENRVLDLKISSFEVKPATIDYSGYTLAEFGFDF